MRDVKVQEAINEQLTKQLELTKLNEAKESANIQVIDVAEPPAYKDGPKRSLIVLFTTATAFLGSIVWVFLLEFSHKIPSRDRTLLSEIFDALYLSRLKKMLRIG
jgi:uncharacterized protein involved in exopolysaccharide biosynthesis